MAGRDVEISKFMSMVLRHAPEQAGLTLDENGWTDFAQLSQAVQERFGVTSVDVRRVVDENPKRRFTLDAGRIRAAQGHSVEIALGVEQRVPLATLFHGTKKAFLSSILSEGLRRQSRQFVHLSPDEETASVVSARREGDGCILQVSAAEMAKDGALFYLSENGVWLTNHVPPKFIAVVERAPSR